MSSKEARESSQRVTREWTLMFYFASDNPLAPSIISQLKSIKDAGFHPEANVIARFDPHTENTPSHIFEVNLINKLAARGEPRIGFTPNDPLVRNLVSDKLWGDGEGSFGGHRKPIKDRIRESLKRSRNGGADEYNPPAPPVEEQEFSPLEALESFLDFCQREYPARNYILFLLGHGLVVGNDLFLFDEHAFQRAQASPDVDARSAQDAAEGDANSNGAQERKAIRQNSLTLRDLAGVLRRFTETIGNKEESQRGELQLVSFHSCSMSGAEVAYELEGTANYMLASQGPAFVGSWPYRSILTHIFNGLVAQKESRKAINVKDTLIKIFFYILYNSFDFQLAGYSFDLSLCNLNRVSELDTPLRRLTRALIHSLSEEADPRLKDMILLSHWEAQSFWQESYHDLYDYCLRLRARCLRASAASGETDSVFNKIAQLCQDVITVLKKGTDGADDGLIVRSAFAGAAYQYSHGLSIFFPWSEPIGSDMWDNEYEHFQFSERTGWKEFLRTYFEATKRRTRSREISDGDDPNPEMPRVMALDEELLGLLEDISTRVFNTDGQLSNDPPTGGKIGSTDPTGSDCGCPTIKNYPSFTQPREQGQDGTGKEDGYDINIISQGYLEQRRSLD